MNNSGRRYSTFIGLANSDASDIIETAHLLTGLPVFDYETQFVAALSARIASSPLAEHYAALQLTPAHLAETLYAVARGFKYLPIERSEFIARVARAARAVCAPVLLT